ncbi:hypothetical protein U9M48_041099, partial [Paspalum notatum var. saurae]
MAAMAIAELQEQIPSDHAVAARNIRQRSSVWDHFTHVTTAGGRSKSKAECNHCHRMLIAETRNGTSSLLRHIKKCKGLGGNETDDLDQVMELEGLTMDPSPSFIRYPPPPPPTCTDPAPPLPLPTGSAMSPTMSNLLASLSGYLSPSPHHPPELLNAPSQHFDEELPDRENGRGDREASSQHLARLITLHPALLEDDRLMTFVGSINPEFKFPSRFTIEQTCDDISDEARMDLLSKLSSSHAKVTFAIGATKTDHGEVIYTVCHFIDDEWKRHNMVMDAYLVTPSPIYYGPLLGVPEASPDESKRLFAIVWAHPKHRAMKMHMKLAVPAVEFTYHPDTMFHSIAGPHINFDSKFNVKIYEKVNGLGLTRERRQEIFSQACLDHLWAYDHHWYACYCSLEFLRRHGSCTIEGTDYSKLIELLCKVWGEIHRAIQRLSTSSYPTHCLEELFKVREILQSELERIHGDSSIVYNGSKVFIHDNEGVAEVLKNAKDALDSIMQDSYLLWSVPLVLDPRYKLKYIKFIFSRAFGYSGAQRYISKVTRKIRNLFEEYTECEGETNSADPDGVNGMAAGSSAVPLGQAWDEHCRLGDDMTDAGSSLDPEKELDRYLEDPCETQTENFDILDWWKANCCKYPAVARMARDALAMPASSKLSSEEMAHVNSIVHGYSKKKYKQA